jgi:hypothetical protein
LTAISSIGTFIVILATAITAIIQLRHLRGSNQISALTECREIIESPEFHAARAFIQNELPALLKEPETRTRLERRVLDPQLQPINFVGNFFENMGAFVKYGIIDRPIALDMWSGVILTSWSSLSPVVMLRRRAFGTQALLENFEYLAVLSEDFIAKNPEGVYPKGVRRMPPTT